MDVYDEMEGSRKGTRWSCDTCTDWCLISITYLKLLSISSTSMGNEIKWWIVFIICTWIQSIGGRVIWLTVSQLGTVSELVTVAETVTCHTNRGSEMEWSSQIQRYEQAYCHAVEWAVPYTNTIAFTIVPHHPVSTHRIVISSHDSIHWSSLQRCYRIPRMGSSAYPCPSPPSTTTKPRPNLKVF